VAAVAAAIGLDPAVISPRLRDLRLKHGLIAKRGRDLALTDKGRAALPAIRALLRQYGHQVLDGQTVPLSKLSAFPLVGLDPQSGIRRQLEAHFRGLSTGLCFRCEAGGWDAAREYARQGLGVAIVPVATLDSASREYFLIRRLEESFAVSNSLLDRGGVTDLAPNAMREAIKVAAQEHESEILRRWLW